MSDNGSNTGEFFPITDESQTCEPKPQGIPQSVLWLQGITLFWMSIEVGISLYAAASAHSVALLAFGSDSLVELLSAGVALLSFSRSISFVRVRADQWAGILLFVLAGVVAVSAGMALISGAAAEVSRSGIAITVAALLVMPVLARFKRRIGHRTSNRALVADAVQSATCAYLAAITLAGLVINAAFHVRWVDSAAALAVLPILVIEGRKAMRGEACGCC